MRSWLGIETCWLLVMNLEETVEGVSVKTRPSHTKSPGTVGRKETGTRNTGGAARDKVRAVEGVFQKPVESRTSRMWTQPLLVVRENPEIKR